MAQLALALALAPHARFDSFVADRNAVALRHVGDVAARGHGTVWLWGGPGCGKTHLLQAACRAADLAGKRAMYVALDPASDVGPDILSGLESVEMLALDQLERVAGSEPWERRLFNLLNTGSLHGGGLLLAARHPPTAVGFALADLASRAAAAVVYRLEGLDEARQVDALVRYAAERGLALDRPAAEYLQHRVARDMTALVGWLDKLDRASLVAQRRLTIPFIRELLAAEARGGD
jgi:DnaA family protein